MKKQVIILCLAVLSCCVSFAQSALTRTRVNGKYGFGYPSTTLKDRNGYPLVETLAIPAKYDETSPTTFTDECEGLVAVLYNGKWGFIDATGSTRIPFKFDGASFFHNGLAPVQIDGKFGYINKTGTVVIPLKYEMANNFYDGIAYVELGNKVGFINKKGDVIIPIKYDKANDELYRKCRHCGSLYDFKDGKAAVILGGKCGAIDMKGNFTHCEDLPQVILDSTFFSGTVNSNKDLWGNNAGVTMICNCNEADVKMTINGVPDNSFSLSANRLVYSFDRKMKPGQKVMIKFVHKKGCTFKLTGNQGFDPDGGKAEIALEKTAKNESVTFSGTSNGRFWIHIMGNYINKISINDIDDAAVANSIAREGNIQTINLKKLNINKGDKITVKVFYNKGGNASMVAGGALDK